jgi:CheY-like chemotaxis protein
VPEVKRILYVEDEADIRAVAEIALKTVGGFELQICADGTEALDTAVAFAPDLLLLDVMMPGMDGPATLLSLWELEGVKGVPAIFMTAKVQAEEIESLKHLGAIGVIAKPFDPMILADQVTEMVASIDG